MESQNLDNTVSRRRRICWLVVSLTILLAIQFGVRIWLVDNAAAIAQDGTFFLPIAKKIGIAPLDTMKNTIVHPGYPAAVAGTHWLITGNVDPAGRAQWEQAALAVAMVASLIAILGVWYFVKLIFRDGRIAFWAAMLLGVGRKFATLGADVLSDSLMLACEIWAIVFVLLAWRRLRRRQYSALGFAACAGVLTAGAYLVRPEGLVVLLIAWAVWLAGQIRFGLRWRQTILAMATAGLAAMVVMAPYVLVIGTLTAKWQMHEFSGPAAAGSQAGSAWSAGLATIYPTDSPAAIRAIGRFFEAQHPALAGLTCTYLLLWLMSRFGKASAIRKILPSVTGSGGFVIAATWFFILPPVIMRYWATGAMSHRYLMLPAALMAGFAPAGLFTLVRLATDTIARKHKPVKFAQAAGPVVAAILAGLLILHALRPLHAKQAFARDAGLWSAENFEPGTTAAMLSDNPLVLYYSGLKGLAVPEDMMQVYLSRNPNMTRRSTIQMIFADGKKGQYIFAAFLGRAGEPYASQNAKIIRDEGFVWVKSFPRLRAGKARAKESIHLYRKNM